MSLDKAIKYGKEKRKPYWNSGAFDRSCRPHGDCPWCRGKEIYKRLRAELLIEPDREQATTQ
jgi:hypothetical protein